MMENEKYTQYWDGDISKWTIAESEHYIIRGEYESSDLYRKSDGKKVVGVGHFYGDPVAGIIDKNEKFCVVVGCGVIVYRIKEPFQEYDYNKETEQWYEFGRGPEDYDYIDEVRQIDDTTVELIDADGNKRILEIDI